MKWTSVEDKFPEDGQLVIATGFDWGCSKNKRHFIVCKYFQRDWLGDEGEEYKYVTHWMPLPEPPEVIE